jgi:hypothetical protein
MSAPVSAETTAPLAPVDYRLLSLQRRMHAVRNEVIGHPLYAQLRSVEDVQTFMEYHVFAVWDFMSLLKTLQASLTSVETAWVPTKHKAARRLINEIVLGEESDVDPFGQPASHYELYLDAMRQAGANTRPVVHFIQTLQRGFSLRDVLRYNTAEVPEAQLAFLRATERIIKRGKLHEIMASFTFGREDLIPDMFTELVRELHRNHPGTFDAFVYYLDRHIELDGDEHGPAALRMMHAVCGDDDAKWAEAEDTVVEALAARRTLWDAILAALPAK